MNRPKIFLTGASGFLGSELAWALAHRGFPIVATVFRNQLPFSCSDLPMIEVCRVDLRNRLEVRRALEQSRPDILIHAAACAKLDQCEDDPGLAQEMNIEATDILFSEWRSLGGGAALFFSTDLVFEGKDSAKTSRFIVESESPSARSQYALSKIAGERLFVSYGLRGAILRICLSFGPLRGGSGGFLRWMDSALRQGEELRLFDDEYRTPLFSEDLVEFCSRVCTESESLLRGSEIYHCGGAERVSRAELGRIFASVSGLPEARIVGVPRGESLRAGDVSLDTERFRALLPNQQTLRAQILLASSRREYLAR